ncbi:MAG: hypothetical protein ABIC91_02105 [Nanoarchaeota archaeon]|nr:hypothetical protein [Nanoarchaeota archaeon]
MKKIIRISNKTKKVKNWSLLIILFVASIIFSSQIFALGVSPGKIIFVNTTRNGYAEERLLISTISEKNVFLDYETSDIDWLEINFENIVINRQNPTNAKLILRIPSDAKNGLYKTKILLKGTPESSQTLEKSSAISSAVTIDISINIIGEEIVSCLVGGVNLLDVEENFPIEISYSIKNTGNVKLRPKTEIIIYDQQEENAVMQTDFYSDEVLPTTNIHGFKIIDNNHSTGQYWVKIKIPMCGYTDTKTFEVVKKGSIIDKGELLRINTFEVVDTGDITPISAVFKNTGTRIVSAKFVGKILKDGKIVQLIETDTIDVFPGSVDMLETYFQPLMAGRYEVQGRVIYNNKLSYEKESVVEVKSVIVSKKSINTNHLFLSGIMLIVIFLLLLIIRKKKRLSLRKKKKHR